MSGRKDLTRGFKYFKNKQNKSWGSKSEDHHFSWNVENWRNRRKPPITSVIYRAEMDSQKMTGSGWQNSISTVSESECLHCSVGEIIMASASLPVPKSHASHWWNLTQNPAIQRKSTEGKALWVAGKFLYLIVSIASVPTGRKIKETEGRKKKGPPPTKALGDVRFRHNVKLQKSFNPFLQAPFYLVECLHSRSQGMFPYSHYIESRSIRDYLLQRSPFT